MPNFWSFLVPVSCHAFHTWRATTTRLHFPRCQRLSAGAFVWVGGTCPQPFCWAHSEARGLQSQMLIFLNGLIFLPLYHSPQRGGTFVTTDGPAMTGPHHPESMLLHQAAPRWRSPWGSGQTHDGCIRARARCRGVQGAGSPPCARARLSASAPVSVVSSFPERCRVRAIQDVSLQIEFLHGVTCICSSSTSFYGSNNAPSSGCTQLTYLPAYKYVRFCACATRTAGELQLSWAQWLCDLESTWVSISECRRRGCVWDILFAWPGAPCRSDSGIYSIGPGSADVVSAHPPPVRQNLSHSPLKPLAANAREDQRNREYVVQSGLWLRFNTTGGSLCYYPGCFHSLKQSFQFSEMVQ